jgi:spore coat polysaccharide biosynthesis predicted glycosyltransferase SpsG/CMP-N-acetylneuraminic acid synthetase
VGNAGLTRQAIAVVFARGTGDAVPFLGARLLAGKPMLHYTIQAAQQSAYVSKVYVSTEDERIAAVAVAAGAEVVLRPEVLAQQQAPLNAAVMHVAEVLREPLAAVGGHLLCLPADAIFCGTPWIDQTLETYFSGDYDQLVGLLPENKKYVLWRKAPGHQLELLVPPPHLRPTTEQLFSEPGVLTIWCVGPLGLPATPQRVGYIILDELVAFRVDTEYDVRVAEGLIAPPHLALRCDGSRDMGMGHIMRLLNIAEHLYQQDKAGWVMRFFVGSDHLEGARLLTQRGFDVDIVRQHDLSHWVQRLEAFKPMVIINDLPFVPAQYIDQLRNLPAKSLTLVDSVADIEPGSAHLDTVISLLDEELSLPHDHYYHGLSFTPFHPSVTSRLEGRTLRRVPPQQLRVLVAFGSGDPARLTQPTLVGLAETQEHWQLATILVQPDQQDPLFWETARRLRCPVEVINAPSTRLGELLDQSDLALVSGGTTVYEASILGLPTIVLCQNQREFTRMQQFERLGSILLLGMGTQVTQAQLVRALRRVATDASLWQRMSVAGQQISDGRGIERITQVIHELLELSDSCQSQ